MFKAFLFKALQCLFVCFYCATFVVFFFFVCFALFVVNIWLGNLTFVRSRVILLLWLC